MKILYLSTFLILCVCTHCYAGPNFSFGLNVPLTPVPVQPAPVIPVVPQPVYPYYYGYYPYPYYYGCSPSIHFGYRTGPRYHNFERGRRR